MPDIGSEPSPLEAYNLVMTFAARRGENALRLALHASLPQVLRADLLHLARLNFLPEAVHDLAAEADVLFAPFCEDLGNGYYRLGRNVRLQLLQSLDPTYPSDATLRSVQVGRFLLSYIDRESRNVGVSHDRVYSDWLEVERWSALAFVEPAVAAAQLASALARATASGAVAARVRVAGLASTLSTPLARYGNLLVYAAGVEALERGQLDEASELLSGLADAEIEVGGVRLKSPRAVLGERVSSRAEPVREDQAEERLEEEALGEELTRDQIYIVYRRGDADRYANDLYPLLRERFGAERVTMDNAEIRPDEDFRKVIGRNLHRAATMIVLIGPQWLGPRDADGRFRLEASDDFVRMQIAEGLRLGKEVVPVLVGGVVMPSAAMLPEDMAELARREAVELTDTRWREDCARLCDVLERVVVFISYARKDNESPNPDERWLDRLNEQLAPLVRENIITIFSDTDIGLGEDWFSQIQMQLNRARAAVLLVSPSYLASAYIRQREMPLLLRNAKERGVRIIPVILRPCLFEEMRFKYPDPKTGPEEFTLASLQTVGSPTKALSEMSMAEQEQALVEVAEWLAVNARPTSSRHTAPAGLRPTEPAKSAPRAEAERLLDELARTETTHERRAEIGDRLDRIGDPRPGVGLGEDGVPDIVWCEVPGGEVVLADNAGSLEVMPFQIAKHPVTYRQYKAFLDDPDGGQRELWYGGKPDTQDRPIGNCPAHSVSWYDAMAFCRWLDARLRDRGELPIGGQVRLPTEWEWQQAAAGGHSDYEYPWGREWSEGRANTIESRLRRTTAVGVYPAGASPAGALDMAGNVWEWCLNKHRDPFDSSTGGEDRRVLRGGSRDDGRYACRCAAPRYHYDPFLRLVRHGFRVCCAPPIG